MKKNKIDKKVITNDKKYFKSSPISIIDNTLRVTWLATILIITNFALIANKINEFNKATNVNINLSANILIIIILSIFIIIMFVYYLINWKITRISYDENKIIVYKNILIKDKYEFLIKNVSGFVVEQNIIDKLFKIYRLKIYTEKINNLKPDAHFVVKEHIMFELKEFIIKKIVKKNDILKKLENINNYDIKINIRDVLIHSFFNISIGNSIIIFNVILLIFSMIRDGTIAKEIFTNLLGFLITILTIVFPILYSIISSILKFYGYKLKKVEDLLLVKYGFLTTRSYFIPILKIKGVIIKETLISRIFNFNLLKVICSGVSSKKGELDFLLPMISKDKLNNILLKILPESNFNLSKDLLYQPNFAISIFLVIFTIANILVIPILMYIKLKALYILIYMAVTLIMILVLYYFKRISINKNYILISTGVFIKNISLILYDSVKYIKISEGVISDKFNIHNLSIYITSNFGSLKKGVGYVTKNNLNRIKKKCFES